MPSYSKNAAPGISKKAFDRYKLQQSRKLSHFWDRLVALEASASPGESQDSEEE